jgi:hypothetical protein
MNHVHFDLETSRREARRAAAELLADARAAAKTDDDRSLVEAQSAFIDIIEITVVALAKLKNDGVHPYTWTKALGFILGGAASTGRSSTSNPGVATTLILQAFLQSLDAANAPEGTMVRRKLAIEGEKGGRA